MKNSKFRKILSSTLCVMMLLAVVFVISSCKEEHVHDFKDECVVDATCTENGLITRMCECGEVEKEVIPFTGHSLTITLPGYEPTCTEPGLRAYEVCENCDYTTRDDEDKVIAPLGHVCDVTVEENIVPPTCTEHGSCDIVEYCERCDVELTRYSSIIISDGHKLETVAAKPATCLPGHYEYKECALCDYIEGYEEIPAAYEHLASVHPIVVADSVVLPTCTVDGSYDMAICCTNDNCGFVFEETRVNYLDPALGHDITEHAAQTATCTEIGWNAYEDCSRCDYTTYLEIPELGHSEKDAVEENRTNPTCAVEGSYDMVVYCANCSMEISRLTTPIEKLPHAEEKKTYTDAKDPTCTEIGWNAYWICGDCGYSTYEQIRANGHTPADEFEIENFVEPTCITNGSYDRVLYCAVCETELKVEHWTVEPVAHNIEYAGAKAPTCTEIGWAAYEYCTKCGVYTTYEEIPATGHAEVKHEAQAVSCTEIGWNAYVTCENCDYTTYEEIPATGHDVVVLAAKKQNCTENGLTEGSYCANCGEVYATQTVIPADGHSYDEAGECTKCDGYISLGLDYVLVNGGYTVTGAGFCGDTDVVIPSEINGVKVTGIAYEAFYMNADITSVVIPDTVEVIGVHAFFMCKNLKSVTIGGNVTVIEMNAFDMCPDLETVYYCGTEAEWAAINIGHSNEDLLDAEIVFLG